jgi:hypothetical protein
MWNFPSFTGQWLQQLSSLQEMSIYSCHTLPSSLGILSSLKKLTIMGGMSNLSIPPNSIPCNLKELQIEFHVQLETRCQNPKGELWREEENMEWQQGKERSGERKLSEVQQSKEEQSMLMKKMSESSFNEMLREDDPLQKERWRLSKLRGMDWPNIAHVPYIRINGKIIQNLYS